MQAAHSTHTQEKPVPPLIKTSYPHERARSSPQALYARATGSLKNIMIMCFMAWMTGNGEHTTHCVCCTYCTHKAICALCTQPHTHCEFMHHTHSCRHPNLQHHDDLPAPVRTHLRHPQLGAKCVVLELLCVLSCLSCPLLCSACSLLLRAVWEVAHPVILERNILASIKS